MKKATELTSKTTQATVIATRDYQAKDARELSIKKGETLRLLSDKNDQWWFCECNGNFGSVPTTHVRKVKAKQASLKKNRRQPAPTERPPEKKPTRAKKSTPKKTKQQGKVTVASTSLVESAEAKPRVKKKQKEKKKASKKKSPGTSQKSSQKGNKKHKGKKKHKSKKKQKGSKIQQQSLKASITAQALIDKIKTHTLNILDERLGHYYVPLQAGFLDTKEERFDLADTLNKDFLNTSTNVCVLFGESGGGKTWFGQHFIRDYWRGYQKGQPIALWVPLIGLDNPEHDIISQHLRNNLRLTAREIKTFNEEGYPLLLVLDGYDELNIDTNLYQTNQLDQWPANVQVLITCRKSALRQGWQAHRSQFQATSNRRNRVLTYEARAFDNQQIEALVTSYTAHQHQRQQPSSIAPSSSTTTTTATTTTTTMTTTTEHWDKTRYLNEMKQLPELNALITRPFILWIVLESLPSIVDSLAKERQRQGEHQGQHQQAILTRHRLYDTFMKARFAREAKRLEGVLI